jgi:hypothetical protein
MALGRSGVKVRLEEFTKDFGDLVVDTLQTGDVAELEEFLSFLEVLKATAPIMPGKRLRTGCVS